MSDLDTYVHTFPLFFSSAYAAYPGEKHAGLALVSGVPKQGGCVCVCVCVCQAFPDKVGPLGRVFNLLFDFVMTLFCKR